MNRISHRIRSGIRREMIPYYTEGVDELPFFEVEHTADWALRINAPNMESMLLNAAIGMYQLMDVKTGNQKENDQWIEIKAHDREELLVSWLEELLFNLETREVVLDINDIAMINEHSMKAQVIARPVTSMEKQIKAVTYHGLHIEETENGIRATVVFDV